MEGEDLESWICDQIQLHLHISSVGADMSCKLT